MELWNTTLEHRLPMSWWDYAYNPYRTPGFRDYVQPYVKLGLKQLGLDDYSTQLMDIADDVNQAKSNYIRRRVEEFHRSNKRVKPNPSEPDKDDDKEDKEKKKEPRSFRKYLTDMSFQRLRRGRRINPVDLFAKYGSVHTIKWYGVATAKAEAAAVTDRYMTKADWGHSTAAYLRLFEGVFRTFIRMLCEKNGDAVVDWNRTATNHFICAGTPTHALAVGFRRYVGGAIEYANVDLNSTTETLLELAVRWYTQFFNKFTGDYTGIAINYIDYFEKAAPQRSLARINLNDAVIRVNCRSVMRMQNRTLGVDGDKSEMTDVSNNPVILRQYDIRGNAVGFKNVSQDHVSAPATSKEVANRGTGYIERFLKDLSVDARLVDPRDVQYCTGFNKKVVKPGHFATSVLVYNRSMKLDKFFDLFAEYFQARIAATSPAVRVPFGVSRVFVAEKYLDTNQTQQPLIGFSCTHTTKVRIVPRNTRIVKAFDSVGVIADDQEQGLILV